MVLLNVVDRLGELVLLVFLHGRGVVLLDLSTDPLHRLLLLFTDINLLGRQLGLGTTSKHEGNVFGVVGEVALVLSSNAHSSDLSSDSGTATLGSIRGSEHVLLLLGLLFVLFLGETMGFRAFTLFDAVSRR